ncbi:MAG: hypothetical protein IKG77_07275 [Prevotella sp.]|nr:hypothetical protein [Prevotella sp.]
MKKTCINWILMATMILGLGMSVTSCSDDDDDANKQGNQENINQVIDPYEKQGQQGAALFRVLSQLAELDSLPNDWKSATFEPVRGIVKDQSQPYTRYVVVSDLGEACLVFQSLSGKNVAESAQTASWQADGVGTMQFSAVNQSDCFATIDVSIRQLPHLTQLRLVPASALGDNALKKASYYRIGDVLRDKDDRRWVCVRSAGYDANDREDKKTTHWVTMELNDNAGTLPSNIKTILEDEKKERISHHLPTNLGGAETRTLKWFAELMWVLQHPDDYEKNIGAGLPFEHGLGGLGTDRTADVNAYDAAYVKALAAKWNEDNGRLWRTFLPRTISKDMLFKDNELCLFYNGYSTEFWGSKVTLYLATQSGNCYSQQSLREVTWDMNKTWDYRDDPDGNQNIYWFDIREYAHDGRATHGYNPGVDHAFVIVQATGKQLNDSFFQPDYDKKFGTDVISSEIFIGNEEIK